MNGRPAAVSIAEQPAQPTMDSAASYLAAILAVIAPLPRRLGLDDADGAVLAEKVRARCPLPFFDNSAMDGYAVLAADVAAAAPGAPVVLPVRDEITASDIRPRQLPAGTRLGPAQIGLLAAAGRDTVLARPRPRLTVLSAGNELAEPGDALVPGRTWESNSFMLAAAAARQAAYVMRRHPVIRDDQGEVLAAVRNARPGTDLLVTSGGISMGGAHDVIKAALRMLGTFSFRSVAMQPGMPQGFARSNALIIVPGQVTVLPAGSTVEVLELRL